MSPADSGRRSIGFEDAAATLAAAPDCEWPHRAGNKAPQKRRCVSGRTGLKSARCRPSDWRGFLFVDEARFRTWVPADLRGLHI